MTSYLPLSDADQFLKTDQFVAWSTGNDGAGVSVTKPFDGKSATVCNGNMVAIMLDSTANADDNKLNAFYIDMPS